MIAAFTLNLSIDRRYVVENSRVGTVNRVKECTCFTFFMNGMEKTAHHTLTISTENTCAKVL